MSLTAFIEKLKRGEAVSFTETIAIINEYYDYQPVSFSNGSLQNAAGTNEGSCKIFAFAQWHQLEPQHTLSLFGDYYFIDVLKQPDANNHQNIRNFMRYGWAGVHFDDNPLQAKQTQLGKS